MKALAMTPSFTLLSTLMLIYLPMVTLFAASASFMFDTVEKGQYIFSLPTYIGFIPFMIMSIVTMTLVGDGKVGPILHYVFQISPLYIPFGIVFQIK